jgi:uncharacterized protein (DUF983 family)
LFSERLTRSVLLRRALRLRCPVCGNDSLYERFLVMRHHCRTCGYRHEREAGYFLGAIYVNYGLTGGVLIAAALLNALVIRAPFQWLLAFALPWALIFPAWFSRYARACWLAFDLSWHPPEEGDFVRREE